MAHDLSSMSAQVQAAAEEKERSSLEDAASRATVLRGQSASTAAQQGQYEHAMRIRFTGDFFAPSQDFAGPFDLGFDYTCAVAPCCCCCCCAFRMPEPEAWAQVPVRTQT